jgi:hypothetical protein
MALIATASAIDANAYCTEAEADAYNETHPASTDWTGDSITQSNAIITATRWLDERVAWSGTKATQAQALRWPRASVTDLDGFAVADTVIPAAIKNAAAELARHIMASGDLTQEADGKGLLSMKVSTIELTYDKADTKGAMPTVIGEMLRGWGVVNTRHKFASAALVRS